VSDARFRQLERTAEWNGAEATARLERMKVRGGLLDGPAQRFTDVLTREGALWLAGGMSWIPSAVEVLTLLLVEDGLDEERARRVAADPALWSRVVDFCHERARREWEPVEAIAVLGSRRRIKAALGIERMPRGTATEERRQRAEWVAQMQQMPWYDETDVMARGWRPRKPWPRVMGWEQLLADRHASIVDVNAIPF
jgi:hypothetical protein